MKKWFALLLALLLCGCASAREDGPTETVYVLVQKLGQHYLYVDSYPDSIPYSWNNKTLYAYNANGECVEERDYSDGELYSKIKYSYDDQGNRIGEKHYDCSGIFTKQTSRTKYAYDDQGRVVEHISYDGWFPDYTWTASYDDENHTSRQESSTGYIWEYTYDELGQWTQCRTTLEDGTVELSTSEYVYDENGNLLSRRDYTDGELTLDLEYTYDDQGRQTRYISYDGSGVVRSTTEYRYDDDAGTVTTIYADGDYKIEYFDEQGNLTRSEQYDKDDQLTMVYTYSYRTMEVPVR